MLELFGAVGGLQQRPVRYINEWTLFAFAASLLINAEGRDRTCFNAENTELDTTSLAIIVIATIKSHQRFI